MRHRFRPTSGRLWGIASALVAAACVYRFSGGGLPSHVRSVAIVPFGNETVQPGLTTDLQRLLQEELPRRLGIRLAPESSADAVVRGRFVSVEEVPVDVRGAGQPGSVDVVQQQLRLVADVEIFDLRENRPLWRTQGLVVVGFWRPDRETVADAQQRALRELVNKIVEGAQSQW